MQELYHATPETEPNPAGGLVPPSESRSVSTQETLDRITAELSEKLSQAAHNLVESGKLLIRAKRLLGHGHFRNWLADHFNMSAKTANRFMAVAQMVDRLKLDEATVSRLLMLDLRTLYELAAKSTPEAVQRQILQELEHERDVSYELVRVFKRQHSELSPSSQREADLPAFAQRLQRFTLWVDKHQRDLKGPSLSLDADTRSELAQCAEKLREAHDLIEELLS